MPPIDKAIDYVTSNEAEIKKSTTVACYYCRKVYPATDVVDFLDDRSAMCPICRVDAVLPDTAGYPFTPEMLNQLHEYWFVRVAGKF